MTPSSFTAYFLFSYRLVRGFAVCFAKAKLREIGKLNLTEKGGEKINDQLDHTGEDRLYCHPAWDGIRRVEEPAGSFWKELGLDPGVFCGRFHPASCHNPAW